MKKSAVGAPSLVARTVLLLIGLWCSTLCALSATTGSLTKWGVTWTFDHEYEYGTYVNGDYWVVGPVTITAISPVDPDLSDATDMHGTTVNVPTGSGHGWDSRTGGGYDRSYNVARSLPLTAQPGDTVSSAVSWENDADRPSQHSSAPWLKSMALLTVVASPPPANSFRPPYYNTFRPTWTADAVNWGNLANYPRSVVNKETYDLASLATKYARPTIDKLSSWTNSKLSITDGILNYGREYNRAIIDGMYAANADYPLDANKQQMVYNLIQIGIDNYGAAIGGKVWFHDGGHQCGRKVTMLFAGCMLDDADILEWCDAQQHLIFQDDMQCFYVTQDDVNSNGYAASMLGQPEWATKPTTVPNSRNPDWGANYRNIASPVILHYVTFARLMGLEAESNWPASFDYSIQRWYPSVRDGWLNSGGDRLTQMWEPSGLNLLAGEYKAYQLDGGATPTALAPVFTPPAGDYTTGQNVAITSATSGATIHYTTDGSTPTTASAVYSAPVVVDTDGTLKAIATKSGYLNSPVTVGSYTISSGTGGGGELLPLAQTPLFQPAGGNYASIQSVSISSATEGATIHYTTDGSPPTPASEVYDGPLSVEGQTTLRAIAVRSGYADSVVNSAQYQIETFSSITDSWLNVAIPAVTESTVIGFDMVPSASGIDSITGFSLSGASWFSDLAIIVRFAPSGFIDARNGSSYAAVNPVPYSAGVRYRVVLQIDMANHTYSATVTPEGGETQVVAENYAFRSEQSSVSSLGNLALTSVSGGTHTVSSLAFGSATVPGPIPPTGVTQRGQ